MGKIKRTKSIVLKMFTITFISIISLITIIFVVQSVYITRYYKIRKIDNIIKNINNFSSQYNNENWSYEELARQIKKFEGRNNVTLKINGIGLTDIQREDYIITLLLDNNSYYDIYLSKQELLKIFNGDMPKEKQILYIEAVMDHSEIIYATKINNYQLDNLIEENLYSNYSGNAIIINIDNVMESILKQSSSNIELQGTESIIYVPELQGTQSNINATGKQETESDINATGKQETESDINATVIEEIESNIIGTQIQGDVIDINGPYNHYTKQNDVYYSISDMPFINIKEVSFIKLFEQDGKKHFIEVHASLQPVGEVISILSDYYIIFYLLAIIVSLLIALIYSRLISYPLLKLSSVADKMANMDFSIKSTIKRNDELGTLSNSLNILSTNLDEALSSLKEANKQLVIDMQKEKKQEKIRKEFVANISHELKTPLGIIKGFAEGIKDGIKKEKTDYYLDVILDETQKMNTLIYDMLELSKIEAKKIEGKEEFNIKKLINRAVSVLEIPINNKSLNIVINGDFGKVIGTKFQIDQVIINLVSNAVKYCNDKTDIIITGEIKDGYNYIYIYNEGNQLSKQEMESIWLRFYKIDKSHHRESGGTGLGLAIVKAILEAHSSDYGVMNKDDGVVFYFSMKLID
ncbi:MAG: HAMP domain-containing histidine kinase [Vallitalea sp.]|jgi:signal transduction histidine kinase|nr:HAMP domain-containing histidine kinase [Vallitalea sp.]